jgi:hypothetical protein
MVHSPIDSYIFCPSVSDGSSSFAKGGSSFIQTMALGSTSATTGQSSTTHRGPAARGANEGMFSIVCGIDVYEWIYVYT